MFTQSLDDNPSRAETGGKAASLGVLANHGFNVPDGFVVTATAYQRFVEHAGIDVAHLLSDGDAADVKQAFSEAELPDDIASDIYDAYDELDIGGAGVAVRSSAIDEDGDDASFAGQQDTYLSVTRDALLEEVKACWASLFTERALQYREATDSNGDVNTVQGGVIVQRMVDADKSGVLFTNDPVDGTDHITIEASYGFGEAVVSGEVSPDRYVIDTTGTVLERTVNEQRERVVNNTQSSGTKRETVPTDKQEQAVLSEQELDELYSLGVAIKEAYDSPQDVEWAYENDELYALQSRPITSIQEEDSGTTSDTANGNSVRAEGLGASPGEAIGRVCIVEEETSHDRVEEGDVMVTTMTTPDMLPAMRRASAIVTDAGGTTCHAAIVARELGLPAVVGTGNATTTLQNNESVKVDGNNGVVYAADDNKERSTDTSQTSDAHNIVTATDVKVNVSLPEAAERASETGADGVGLLRMENMMLRLGQTPRSYIDEHGFEALVETLIEDLETVLAAFDNRPVRIRTLDAPTDEYRNLEGGEDEPDEHNPMLGYRGIRRDLAEPDVFEAQLTAFARLRERGYTNLEFMFPLITDEDDVTEAKRHAESAGLSLEECRWGVMIETPASAIQIESIADTGIDFISFGTNDLTQYTLAVDRNNERVAHRFDEDHPAVLTLMRQVIDVCSQRDIETSICGEAASKDGVIEELVSAGVDSLSVNIDAVGSTRRSVKKVEQQLLLDDAR